MRLIKMIKDVQEMKKAKQALQFRFIHFPVRQAVGTEGTIVVVDHEFVRAHGYQLAVVATYENGKHDIFVDNVFMDLSPETQQFIIEHEIGHIMHRHKTELKQRQWDMFWGKVHQHEIEADQYAAHMVGKEAAIRALKELYKITYNRELKRRAKLIAKN